VRHGFQWTGGLRARARMSIGPAEECAVTGTGEDIVTSQKDPQSLGVSPQDASVCKSEDQQEPGKRIRGRGVLALGDPGRGGERRKGKSQGTGRLRSG
jgi:hypothetical protein